ncbi:hypothetical protein DPMN_182633 [Dreissena polymorpha]|uniref:Uncharacterized protein n=1 Tax=Dreissena polymorpha TaxID=45954 RepID=A0A9D4I4S1_DREPO|nr:hypothetical protein DPMN_182633 [Dreissena polymorpha]
MELSTEELVEMRLEEIDRFDRAFRQLLHLNEHMSCLMEHFKRAKRCNNHVSSHEAANAMWCS